MSLSDNQQVAVIGAGLAGVTAGALLPAKVPGIQLTILEKNSDVVCL
jgi:cation diffusion facilitator CzcD-associated flavoprotein CzcO